MAAVAVAGATAAAAAALTSLRSYTWMSICESATSCGIVSVVHTCRSCISYQVCVACAHDPASMRRGQVREWGVVTMERERDGKKGADEHLVEDVHAIGSVLRLPIVDHVGDEVVARLELRLGGRQRVQQQRHQVALFHHPSEAHAPLTKPVGSVPEAHACGARETEKKRKKIPG